MPHETFPVSVSQPETLLPDPNDGITDIVKVDGYNRGHRPDGKFLSTYEMEQIASHEGLIRQGIAELSQTAWQNESLAGVSSIVQNETEKLSSEMPIPHIDTSDTSADRQTGTARFFAQRKSQLTEFGATTNRLFQRAFGRDIAGVQITGQTWLRSRLHPSQLKRNFKGNVANTLGRPNGLRNRVVENPVLRNTFYNQALAGDKAAENYLRSNDPNFGKANMTLAEAAKEAATVLSGIAVARKTGRIALALAIRASYSRTAPGTEKAVKLEGKAKKILEAEQYHIGARRFEKREQAYAELKQFGSPTTKDPFARR